MPAYDRAKELALSRNERAGGRNIWVDNVNGTSTGDGSYGNPYDTITLGIADIRSGYGDILWIRGTGTNYREAGAITMVSIDDFSILGVGNPVIDPPVTHTQNLGSTVPTATSYLRYPDASMDIYWDQTHGLAVGQYIFLVRGPSLPGTYNVCGPWYVGWVDAPTKAIWVQPISPWTSAPVQTVLDPPTDLCNFVGPVSWRFEGCSNVVLDGLDFQGLGTSQMQAIWIREQIVSTFNKGRNFLIANNSFTNTMIALHAREGTADPPSLFNPSVGLVIEGNIFSSTCFGGTGKNKIMNMPFITLDGGNESLIQGNLFQRVPYFTAAVPDTPGIIRYFGREPKMGTLVTGNTIGEYLNADNFYGWCNQEGPNYNGCSDSDRIQFTRNVYIGEPGQVQTISQISYGDPTSARQELEASAYIHQDVVPSHSDLMFGLDPASAVEKTNTLGEQFVKSVLYAEGVYIDTVNGTAGDTLGVNGTRTSPVDNITDARTLADAAGVQKYFIVYAPSSTPLTLNATHQDWAFFGAIGPEENVIDVNGQDVDGSAFERVEITGDIGGAAGAGLNGVDVYITDTTGLKGVYATQLFKGTNVLAAGATFAAAGAKSGDYYGVTLDLNGATGATNVSLGGCEGVFNIEGCDNASGNTLLVVSAIGAQFTFVDGENDGGLAIFLGTGANVTNTTSTFVVDWMITHENIQDQILSDSTTFAGALIPALNNLDVVLSTRASQTDVTLIKDLLEATTEYDTSTDPWEEKWIRQSDATTLITFQLYDDNLNAINNSNPLSGSRVRRRLKV